MLYKNVRSIVRSGLLLLLGVSGCVQVPIHVVSDAPTAKVSLKDVCFQGRVVCSQGSKYAFLVQAKISNPQSKGHVGIVGLPKDVKLDHNLLKQAMEYKDHPEKLEWQDKNFIYWQRGHSNGDGKFLFTIKEDELKKCDPSSYDIYMIYVEHGSAGLVHSSQPRLMDIPAIQQPVCNATDSSKSVQLETQDHTTGLGDGSTTWKLKATIENIPEGACKVGFILTKPELDQYTCVSKVIASDRGWPEKIAFLDDCIIVPGAVRGNNIGGELLESDKLPIGAQDQHYNIFCYLKQDNQYYLAEESKPITLKGKQYPLQKLAIEVSCTEELGNVTAVSLKDNRQQEDMPNGMEACVLFFKKKTIWRTHEIKALYKQMKEEKSQAAMTKDQRLCLVADKVEQLDSACLSFFSSNFEYEYFTCLFDKSHYTVKCYTKQKDIKIPLVQNQSVRTNQSANKPANQPKKSEGEPLKPVDLKIGPAVLSLGVEGQSIQKVELSSPDFSSGSGFKQNGFLMVKHTTAALSDAEVSGILHGNVVKTINSPVFNNAQGVQFFIYKVGDETINEIIKETTIRLFWIGNQKVDWSIIYWEQDNNDTIQWSKPAELKIEVKDVQPKVEHPAKVEDPNSEVEKLSSAGTNQEKPELKEKKSWITSFLGI